DEDAVADGDAVVDQGGVLDLHPVADRHALVDEDVATDDAFGAQSGAGPDLGAVPDAGGGPDGHVRLEVRGLIDTRGGIDHGSVGGSIVVGSPDPPERGPTEWPSISEGSGRTLSDASATCLSRSATQRRTKGHLGRSGGASTARRHAGRDKRRMTVAL